MRVLRWPGGGSCTRQQEADECARAHAGSTTRRPSSTVRSRPGARPGLPRRPRLRLCRDAACRPDLPHRQAQRRRGPKRAQDQQAERQDRQGELQQVHAAAVQRGAPLQPARALCPASLPRPDAPLASAASHVQLHQGGRPCRAPSPGCLACPLNLQGWRAVCLPGRLQGLQVLRFDVHRPPPLPGADGQPLRQTRCVTQAGAPVPHLGQRGRAAPGRVQGRPAQARRLCTHAMPRLTWHVRRLPTTSRAQPACSRRLPDLRTSCAGAKNLGWGQGISGTVCSSCASHACQSFWGAQLLSRVLCVHSCARQQLCPLTHMRDPQTDVSGVCACVCRVQVLQHALMDTGAGPVWADSGAPGPVWHLNAQPTIANSSTKAARPGWPSWGF